MLVRDYFETKRTFKPGDRFVQSGEATPSAVIVSSANRDGKYCLMNPHTNRLWNGDQFYTTADINAIPEHELAKNLGTFWTPVGSSKSLSRVDCEGLGMGSIITCDRTKCILARDTHAWVVVDLNTGEVRRRQYLINGAVTKKVDKRTAEYLAIMYCEVVSFK